MPKAPELTEEQKKQVAETIIYWASVHPNPDQPLATSPSSGKTITVREWAQAAAQPDSEDGKKLFLVFSRSLIPDDIEQPETLDQILADYRKDADAWAAQKKPVSKPRKSGPTP